MRLKQKLPGVVFSIFIFCLLIFQIDAVAQINYRKEFHQLSCPEKRWVFFHPFIAKKCFRLTMQAREAAKEMLNDALLDKDVNGGQNDAFRHAFWMALLSQHICRGKARWLGKAHERGNYLDFKKRKTEEGALPDSASGAMDLYNNAVGIEIGQSNRKLSADELKKIIRNAIVAGKMEVIRKNKNGDPLDCNGNKIDLRDYLHQWNIPKCLVKSDSVRE